MTMKILYGAAPEDIKGYDTERLRRCVPDHRPVCGGYWRTSPIRMSIVLLLGGAMPVTRSVTFGSGADIGTSYLLSAREMGIANLGGTGTVTVDGQPLHAPEPRRSLCWTWRS